MAGSTIKSANLAKVSAIDFVDQFKKNIDRLKEVLGITRMIEKVPGTVVKTYKVSGKLEDGKVAEGADIPLSSYHTEVSDSFELEILKWRKDTTLEAINDKGYQQAVIDTDNALMGDVQFSILDTWFAFLTKTDGRTSTKGKGLRGALAKTRAKLRTVMKNYGVKNQDLIYFVNEDDVADYLSEDKNYATMSEEFGMTYVEKFLGLFNVIVSPDITPGKVFGTPKNNIIMYYSNPANDDIAAAFEFEVDETGLVGIAHDSTYKNLTTETVVISGINMYTEYETFVVYATIEAVGDEPTGSDAPSTQSLDTGEIAQAVASGVATALTGQELSVEKTSGAPESVDEKSTKPQLEAYAEARGIDLSDCNTNAERLDAIQKAEAAD